MRGHRHHGQCAGPDRVRPDPARRRRRRGRHRGAEGRHRREQREITEINSGIYAFDGAPAARRARPGGHRQRPGREVPDRCRRHRPRPRPDACAPTSSTTCGRPRASTTGCSSPASAPSSTAVVVEALMRAGVTIVDPATTWIDADVSIGRDSVVRPGCQLLGATTIGAQAETRPGRHPRRRARSATRATYRPDGTAQPRRSWATGPSSGPVTVRTLRRPASGRRAARRSARLTQLGADRRPPLPKGDRRVSSIKRTTEKSLMILSGRAHPALAEEVAACLGIDLVPTTAYEFANCEIYVRFEESVRGSDAFVHPEPHRPDQRVDHGAPDHGRRAQAGLAPSGSPWSCRSTATPGRTRSTAAASRSRRGSWPTCSRPPAPTG